MKSSLVIKDLAVDKELGASEMAVVRGGSKFVIQPFPSYGSHDDYCGTPFPHSKVPPMPGPFPPWAGPIKLPGMVYAD